MPIGRENQMMREALRAFIARRSGGVGVDGRMVVAADLEGHLTQLAHMNEYPHHIFYNDDGTPWKPQNDDGSFPFLPGYDGPVE